MADPVLRMHDLYHVDDRAVSRRNECVSRGVNKDDGDKVSSQDAHSVADEAPDQSTDAAAASHGRGAKNKSQSTSEGPATGARRSSQQHAKSPLPALTTLHQSLPSSVSGKAPVTDMKPAPLPTIPTGQPLKYASAAAAAAASDKSGVGIAPLPPYPIRSWRCPSSPAPSDPISLRLISPLLRRPSSSFLLIR